MDGYMTIGEVAKVKQISIKALRYYEKIGILKPAYCDPNTGYRYYKNEQMLADFGYPAEKLESVCGTDRRV